MAPLLCLYFFITISAAAGLAPAAPEPPSHFQSAADIPEPTRPMDCYEPSAFDNALLAIFRWTMQRQSGIISKRPGMDGLAEEMKECRTHLTIEEQATISHQTMVALAGPVPFVFKNLFSGSEILPPVLAWFAKYLLPFLVGNMTLTTRGVDDDRGGGVLVEHCRVLDASGCKGVCARMCKLPTQQFFMEEWGVPLTMTPNFETGQCQLSFGKDPIPIENDPTIPPGCFTRCPAAMPIAGDGSNDSDRSC